MCTFWEFVRHRILRRNGRKISTLSIEELRAAFKSRYHHFKLLLNANNKALEIMAEMEEALKGARPFGMSFVKARCTAVTVSVFQIIRNLDQLAPGKYEELHGRFREIQERINRELGSTRTAQGTRLVIPLEAVTKEMADEVGSKMATLGEIANRFGIKVPDGFVVSSTAYRRFMEQSDLQAEIDRRIQASNVEEPEEFYELSASIQQLIIRSAVPSDIEQEVLEAYARLERREGQGVKVSMRSSALGEDVEGATFAGQYRSELNVSAEHLVDAYKEIIASKYSPQAMTYRMNRGIRDEDIAMCVGCMVMIDAVSGGVMYSRNPVNLRDDSIIINAAWGLPKSVVDGAVACDLFSVARSDPMVLREKDIKRKEFKYESYPEEGIRRVDVTGEESVSPSISDAEALELAAMAVRLEQYYGTPQDIEWALARDGTVYILQCRPLQRIERAKRREGVVGAREEEGILLEGGVVASPGVACGEVFIVEKSADVLRFPDGAVLVARQPVPRLASLLNRAAGVVSEQGGVTGHLANVAREFGVPALFGVPGAVALLRNKGVVTIDADNHRIYQGRIDSLLGDEETRKNLMKGSPVYEVLQAVTKHIVPLTLLDPDAPSFKPQKCKTLHDITRFAHEKSVQEMFIFGREYRFPERSSKQLVCDVPMQWWVINLDDGFKEEVEGKFIQISNIISIPMKALWEGITAVPWQGPPPVNAKGFMSVMFQATANPALDPSMKSEYAERNYFMISRNFCSLQSRFGFHFSTIETLVSERAGENYVSFSFKGGAADYQRRIRRVVFVANLLSEFGFRVDVKEDAVFARLEGYDEHYMKERLKILGYVIIHTRQLDMIMTDGTSITAYRTKMMKDIDTMLTLPEGRAPFGV